jgi:hypothetical protein
MLWRHSGKSPNHKASADLARLLPYLRAWDHQIPKNQFLEQAISFITRVALGDRVFC